MSTSPPSKPPYRSTAAWIRLSGAMAPTYLISSDLEALIEGAEPLEAVVHGDGTGRFLGGVAFPTAEAGDDPAGPGEGGSGMRIALFFRAPLKVRLQGVERRDFVGGEGVGRRPGDGSVARLDQDDRGRMQRGQRQLHQAAGGLDLTGLDVQALPFQGSEQLLDLPARLIPADDPQGLLDAGDIVA